MIGFIGGTGPEGRGLALRFALAGQDVLIGSRELARASEAAEGIASLAPSASVSGSLNERVATDADPVFVTVPYSAHRDTLSELGRASDLEATYRLGFDHIRSKTVSREKPGAFQRIQGMLADHLRLRGDPRGAAMVQAARPGDP